jgi:hypothetical protein
MGSTQFSLDQRQRMIAEAAYFRAEHRGFQGGDPLKDWLQAEAEIDRMADRGRQPPWLSLAEQLTARLREWDGDFARLSVTARDVSTTVRAELERELEQLKPLRTSAGKALEEARQRGGQAIDDLRALSERVRNELADGLETLAKRLR